MFHTATNYVRERKDGVLRKATYVGGAYLAWQHVTMRFKELRDAQIQQKFAEDRCVIIAMGYHCMVSNLYTTNTQHS